MYDVIIIIIVSSNHPSDTISIYCRYVCMVSLSQAQFLHFCEYYRCLQTLVIIKNDNSHIVCMK